MQSITVLKFASNTSQSLFQIISTKINKRNLALECPSSLCWDYDVDSRECILKRNSSCLDVICLENEVQVEFKSELFKNSDAVSMHFGNGINPTFDENRSG